MHSILSYLTAAVAVGPFARDSTPAPLNDIPLSTRNYWMSRANAALHDVTGNPCPAQAFGTVIVNHTTGGLGELICIGANNVLSGNPTLHGETAAINNCSAILTDPKGPYKLSGQETLKAWADLTLYTNAEPCPMCATAIRWAGFKELVFGSSTKSLKEYNWTLINLPAAGLFKYTTGLPSKTAVLGGVLANETDPYFKWQFTEGSDCPPGCKREGSECHAKLGGHAKSDENAEAASYWSWLRKM